MTVREVTSPARASERARERTALLTMAALIAGGVGFFLLFRPSGIAPADQRRLLPYQALVRTLATPDQRMYAALRQGLPDLELDRATTSRWPEPEALAARGVAPFGDAASDGFTWHRFQHRSTVNYLGLPSDPSAPAWLLAVREPEANDLPDPAPLDDEHHRLPDGTTLHIYIWMHRFGGRVSAGFVPQPSTNGWTEIFATPPNPVPSTR